MEVHLIRHTPVDLKNNIYYADDYIKEILFSTKSIAIVGLSDKENRPSNFAAKYLKNRGYKIIPVNPVTNKKTILGEKVYKSISELSDEKRNLVFEKNPDIKIKLEKFNG